MQQWNLHLRLVWEMLEKQGSFSLGKIMDKKKASIHRVDECSLSKKRRWKTSLKLLLIRLIATWLAFTLRNLLCLGGQRCAAPKARLFAPTCACRWGNLTKHLRKPYHIVLLQSTSKRYSNSTFDCKTKYFGFLRLSAVILVFSL